MWRNALLALASTAFALGAAEAWLRWRPPPPEPQTNDEYQYRERVGERRFLVPYHRWLERFPAELDERGYFARGGLEVEYAFNQLGARWREAAEQPLAGRLFLVLGDSFTYGSAVRHEDTWVERLQESLRAAGHDVTFLNFGRSGADSVRCLEIYRELRERVPHHDVLYALNVNDLVAFPTSYVIRNPVLEWPLLRHSELARVASLRIDRELGRRRRLAHITSPDVFRREKFSENVQAIDALQAEVRAAGRRLHVALLPVLIELESEPFRPVYDGIRARLAERGIELLDTTGAVRGLRDADLWVLPVDQHPNEVANALLAERLATLLAGSVAKRDPTQ